MTQKGASMPYLRCDYDVIVTLFKGQFNGGHIEDVSCQIPVNFAIGSWEPVGAGWRFAEFPQSPPTPVCLSALPDVNPQIYDFVIKENQSAVFHSSPWKRVFQATLRGCVFRLGK